MNKILSEIKKIAKENISKYLPDVKMGDLEENGMIYYMNGNNGTEFDWHVNGKISSFMAFYNDKKNLGAIKLTINTDSSLEIYIYGAKGEKLVKEEKTTIDVSEDEIFKLAVILKNQADDKKIWDASIEKINSDIEPTEDEINEFIDSEKNFSDIKKRMKYFNLSACVSKKIIEEGWKVGYMRRDEPLNESDSGWVFMAGNEEQEYVDDYKNLGLLSIFEIYKIDPDIWNYIDNPVGTSFIRISSNKFELDTNEKEIYTEKRDANR
ncbi:MAG: DUF2185 domain-containing protein [Clostridia bacterium]|nr:DUF2185 domain-containing protein [Clostridia bacterium]